MPEKENNNQWEKTITSTWNREINTISSHLKARLLHIRPSRSSWFVSAYSVFRVAFTSLRSRHFGSSGHRKKRAREKTREGTRVSPSRAPVLSFAHYFWAPATQARLSLADIFFITNYGCVHAILEPLKAVRYVMNSNGRGWSKTFTHIEHLGP